MCGSYNTHYTVLIKYWLLAGSIYRRVFRPTGKFMCHVVYRMITSGHLLCVAKVTNAARAIKVLHIISVAVAMFFCACAQYTVMLSLIAPPLTEKFQAACCHVNRIPGNKLVAITSGKKHDAIP